MEGLATVQDPFAFDSSCCDAMSIIDAFTGTVIPDPSEPCLAGEASTCALAVESFDPNAQLWENAPLCADGADSPTLEDGSPACVWTGVDPRIVCAFALFGLLFDIGSLFAFRSYGQADVGELVGTKKADDESEVRAQETSTAPPPPGPHPYDPRRATRPRRRSIWALRSCT